jgi:hypothetical protein
LFLFYRQKEKIRAFDAQHFLKMDNLVDTDEEDFAADDLVDTEEEEDEHVDQYEDADDLVDTKEDEDESESESEAEDEAEEAQPVRSGKFRLMEAIDHIVAREVGARDTKRARL